MKEVSETKVLYNVTKNSVPVGLFEQFNQAEEQAFKVYEKGTIVIIDAICLGVTDLEKLLVKSWILTGEKVKAIRMKPEGRRILCSSYPLRS